MTFGKINMIVAASENMVIGNNNDIPWKCPIDMKYFMTITRGNTVLMGRLCFESMCCKPLKNRKNVIITRDVDYVAEGCEVRHDLLLALEEFMHDDELYVIGGGQIYKEAFPYVNKLFITRLHKHIEGNVYLEGFNEDEWILISRSEEIIDNGIPLNFEIYERKK